jgi:cysteine synthase A
MTEVVGGTPLVQLGGVVPDGAADVFVKLEWFNPTGSYKDRMALATIEEAERRGDLRRGMTVLEYTGGSTGSSLAFVCAVKGYRFVAVSSDAFAEEKLKTMRAFGAEVVMVESEGGQITGDLIPRLIAKATELAAEPDTYFTDQLNNSDMQIGYRAVGHEILEQLDRPIDVFCAGVGTSHFAMGVATGLSEGGSEARIVVFEPATTAVISGKKPGTHHVEGIGIGFVPPMLDPDRYDEVRAIDERDARDMARRLVSEEGLFAGVSSAFNIAGAVQIAEELGGGHAVVTAAVDTGLKYLTGSLYEP